MASKPKVYLNTHKKKGYGKSTGKRVIRKKGESEFVLTNIKTGKERVYESQKAAGDDGWIKV